MRTSRVKPRTARRTHRCHLCDHTIRPGSVYETWTYYGDDRIATVRVHRDCWAVWSLVERNAKQNEDWSLCAPLLEWCSAESRAEAVRIAGDFGGEVWDRVLREPS